MKENYTHKSTYFCGNKISEYGLKNGYVDYATLAKAFDAVLCNDITKLFYSTIDGEYNEIEQVSGFIDNQDEIDELQEKIDELQEKIDELQQEQDDAPEIFQYFIVSDAGAELLKDYGEIVYYLPALDVYIWGVTHYGTSWDYVLTNIKIDLSED